MNCGVQVHWIPWDDEVEIPKQEESPGPWNGHVSEKETSSWRWREGVDGEVRNLMSCGSCWMFSFKVRVGTKATRAWREAPICGDIHGGSSRAWLVLPVTLSPTWRKALPFSLHRLFYNSVLSVCHWLTFDSYCSVPVPLKTSSLRAAISARLIHWRVLGLRSAWHIEGS